jgi:aminomuconate-semialdehyde/2-hydroxymuconate-6-semialdehyde dehydrogenase
VHTGVAIENAHKHMHAAPMTLPKLPCFIDGVPVFTSNLRDNHNPATGAPYQAVCDASRDDVDRAVQAAKRAQRGWAQRSAKARAAALMAVADAIDARRDDFLRAEIADTGKPLSLAERVDIPRGAANFRVFAEQLLTLESPSFFTQLDDGRRAQNTVVHQPLGVVGIICPWNLPLLLLTWKVAPALAAGNAVVVKPSEETPHTATLLGEIMNAVGMPAGLYNVVHGLGPQAAGEFIVEHPDVAAVTFTGESKTGSSIMQRAAPTLKRLSFELGGKNPALIFADCDLDAAVQGTLQSTMMNTGQVCLCTERVYVQRSIFDSFCERLVVAARSSVLGNPMLPTTTMGPLISGHHRDKVVGYFAKAKHGATVLTGGDVAEVPGYENGYWVQPTLWTGMSDDHPVVREEVFGPCAAIMPFDDEDEAVHRANSSEYGLCAAVWTTNLARAQRVSRAVEAGLVWVNTWYLRDLRTPFGGMKRSGIGREGGRYSFDFYAEPKNICLAW